MKLLGLSAGRKNGNGEILLKEALMAAQAVDGVDVEIVRLHDLEINPCTGCEGCTQSLSKGGTGECVRWPKDDALWLRSQFDACDGLIMSAPCFVIRPSGWFCTMNDRFLGFSPRFLMGVFQRKKRVGAAIASGGSDWTQFMLTQMMPPFFMLNIKVIDQFQAHWVGRPGHVLLKDQYLQRAAALGRNVAEAMKRPAEETAFLGDKPGVCPYCHTDLLVMQAKCTVQCPVCGIHGTLRIQADEVAVEWSEEDLKHIRWEPLGMGSHFNDIKAKQAEMVQGAAEIKIKLEKYKAFSPYVKPAGRVEQEA
ncbi:MAG: flavodoxin family protein [Deferrisomatales bacterium]|nr:flavodoxin family protein [Deferrisomatales bacterium]